jgi:hypothetical protein
MHRLGILASVVALVVSCVNCGNSPSSPSPSTPGLGSNLTGDSSSAATDAKGGGGGSTSGGTGSSLTLVMVQDLNGNGLPNWGDTVTFNISTTSTAALYVALTCNQNGSLVYSTVAGFYPTYPWPWTQHMTLSSQWWTGGAADCSAQLYYSTGKQTITLAWLYFTAGA